MSEIIEKEPLISNPTSGITGSVDIPGDKSISHRSLLISAISVGKTRISGLLEGEDVLNTGKALAKMGAQVERKGEKNWEVYGLGVGGLLEASDVLDFGNAGTGARLIMGLLATHPFNSFFTGDASLRRRPMERVMKPLRRMGATFVTSSGGRLPIAMSGPELAMPIEYEMDVASAQVKSAILLAALNAPGVTTVIEHEPTRDHTERMLRYFGAKIKTEKLPKNKVAISIQGEQELISNHNNKVISVPADPSSAAFIVVAALITKNSKVTVKNVCVNPHRVGLFQTLKEMGAKLEYKNLRSECGEQVADIVAESSELKGVEVPATRAPSMIDEYPILAVAASFAEGKTTMLGLAELKVKESNRLKGIADGLTACDVKIEVGEDSLVVYGSVKPKGGGNIRTNMDHRIAMAFLVFGMAAREAVAIDDGGFIKTSFPDFIGIMNSSGAKVYKREVEKPVAKKVYDIPKGKKPIVVAVDGPAASGKGTLSRRIAETLGYAYLDTGSLYRAVGLKLVYGNKDPHSVGDAVDAARGITLVDLTNPRLRQERVGKAASVVAAIPEVRQELLEFQREFARSNKGVVLDGRDIGTVVCPDADVKFFVTASIAARAKRRHREIQGQGIEVIFSSVLADLEERDERDRKRDTAPMMPAADALILDSTRLSANEVFDKVMEVIKTKLSNSQS